MQFTTVALLAFSLIGAASASASASASPELETRHLHNAQVTYPHAGTVWRLGGHHNVTWKTNDLFITGTSTSALYLRKDASKLNRTLAHGFELRKGYQPITVPKDVAPGSGYFVILDGASGTAPRFKIMKN